MKDRSTGHPRGFGFVTFADASACEHVVQDKHVINGRTVSGGELFHVPDLYQLAGPAESMSSPS
jgi:RNA recognition motif-containing protein